MLAGQPPFQSSSQNEIYRRARSVDYAWPRESKHSNDIPEEAKDLVARLLKVDAEERPDPDQVVGHSFFSMHGGDAIPAKMEECFRFETPHYLDSKARPRGDVMLEGTRRLRLRTLAKQCGVGHLPGDVKPQATVGADMDISLYRVCAAEEAAGASPVVPLPKDMVYASKYSSITWSAGPVLERNEVDGKVPTPVLQEKAASRISLQREIQKDIPERGRRNIQSHAATLRAAHVSTKPRNGTVDPRLIAIDGGLPNSKDLLHAPAHGRRGLLNELPVRPTCSSAGAGDQPRTNLERRSRTGRSKKVIVLDDDPPDSATAAKPREPITKDEYIDATSPDPDKIRRDMAARNCARIASNVQKEMDPKSCRGTVMRKASDESETVRCSDTSASSTPATTLIGPDEATEYLPSTKSDDVLSRLGRLKTQFENSLDSASRCCQVQPQAEDIERRIKAFKDRPVVVKWVDYTNKFGIGYILANGTVGCVFKGDDNISQTCIVVADAEQHLKKRKTCNYADKHQIVPRGGPPVQFIENCGDQGLKRVLGQASQYQIKVAPSGNPDRLGPGTDAFDHEKRKKLCLWDKFGKYMTQTLGKSAEDDATLAALEEPSANTSRNKRSRSNPGSGPFIRFYQRLGNVGIWGFGDNSFQFNFPDHTKLVISADGTWLDFYHLPVSAAKVLRRGERLEASDLAERSVLCYPTDIMLRGQYEGHKFEEIINENELRQKVEFVKNIVGIWMKEGGLGCMGSRKGLMWKGIREVGGKAVWVSVGARGGDGRYELPAGKD